MTGLGLRSLRSLRPRPVRASRVFGRVLGTQDSGRPKGDILTLEKRGHFNFALTAPGYALTHDTRHATRDTRGDYVQIVIVLIVTPEEIPLAYVVMSGNTSDKTTLADFLERIEQQYGQSDRVWIMDLGIPTKDTLASMRTGQRPVHYLVGIHK